MIIITTIIIIVIIFFFQFFSNMLLFSAGVWRPQARVSRPRQTHPRRLATLRGVCKPKVLVNRPRRPRHVGLHPMPACANPRHVALVCYPGAQVCRPQARESGPSTQGMTAPASGFCSLIMPQQNRN